MKEVETAIDERLSIGCVTLPFAISEKRILVYDEDNVPIYEIVGSSF
jgi:hypothetical protein